MRRGTSEYLIAPSDAVPSPQAGTRNGRNDEISHRPASVSTASAAEFQHSEKWGNIPPAKSRCMNREGSIGDL